MTYVHLDFLISARWYSSLPFIVPISVLVKNGTNQKSRKTGMIDIRKE
jgi:hypothetical protein